MLLHERKCNSLAVTEFWNGFRLRHFMIIPLHALLRWRDTVCVRIFFFEPNHTPSGKKTVTGMQVVTSLVPRPSTPRPFGKLEREKWKEGLVNGLSYYLVKLRQNVSGAK